MSIGALMAARDLGVAIPDTLSIICFDNFDVNNVSNPRLVCLEQPVYEIGITTAKLLLRRLQGKADECSIVRLIVYSFWTGLLSALVYYLPAIMSTLFMKFI